jgi:hypothetical protein
MSTCLGGRVLRICRSNQDCLYLSVRDRIGPYDSVYLREEYARRLSIHDYNAEGKTRLLDAIEPGTAFTWRQSVVISFLERDAQTGVCRVQIA